MSTDDISITFFARDKHVSDSVVEDAGAVLRKAFTEFNKSHNAHPDVYEEEFGNAKMAHHIVQACFNNRESYVCSDSAGQVVGVTFVDTNARGSEVATLGPVSSVKAGAGRKTFEAACDYAEGLGFTTLVLMQIAANTRSFSLYAKLGFKARHTCQYLGGFLPPECGAQLPEDLTLAVMTAEDVPQCVDLFEAAHSKGSGVNREPDITAHVKSDIPFVRLVARDTHGTVVGYTTGFYIEGHTVATSQEVFCAMFAESSRVHQQQGLPCPRFHLPMEYSDLLSWALTNKLTYYRACIIMVKGDIDHAWPESGHVVAPSIAGW